MMRWLHWGSDDGAWTAGDISHALIVRRLRSLEHAANTVGTYEDSVTMSVWQLGLDAKCSGQWATLFTYPDKREDAVLGEMDISERRGCQIWKVRCPTLS